MKLKLLILFTRKNRNYHETLYSRTSIIRGFWDQNLVRPTYMKYNKTSIIRSFWDQNLVRPNTADGINRGLPSDCIAV